MRRIGAALICLALSAPALAQQNQSFPSVGPNSAAVAAGQLPAFSGDCASSAGTADLNCNAIPHPGYIASNWYSPVGTTNIITGAAGLQNTIVCSYGAVAAKLTINALAVKITTLSAGGHIQLAIYSNNAGRPGALLSSTASLSTASSGVVVSAALGANQQVGPGGSNSGRDLWFCSNQDNGTASIAAYVNNAASFPGWELGSSNVNNLVSNIISGVSCAGASCQGGSSTFNSWPANLGTSTWSDIVTNVSPFIMFQVNSVP